MKIRSISITILVLVLIATVSFARAGTKDVSSQKQQRDVAPPVSETVSSTQKYPTPRAYLVAQPTLANVDTAALDGRCLSYSAISSNQLLADGRDAASENVELLFGIPKQRADGQIAENGNAFGCCQGFCCGVFGFWCSCNCPGGTCTSPMSK
jgi:hypothetical protein